MNLIVSDEREPDRNALSSLSGREGYLFSAAAALIYYLSNRKPQYYYDYTFRVAGNLLMGRTGFAEPPPPWLNEFVPFDGLHYSVFPLGAVLTMVPAALLKAIGIIAAAPGMLLAALSAGVTAWFLLALAARYRSTTGRSMMMAAGVLFGTFMWTNLTFAGAWQLALGFAMIGELGAIYFSVYDRRPVLAGAFFALAFGNRTENLLTAPVLMYLISLSPTAATYGEGNVTLEKGKAAEPPQFKPDIGALLKFSVVPFLLGIATLAYNYERFGDIADFGYARIPGVLDEPWYNHGIFSIQYIPRQAWEMLGKVWEVRSTFPYLFPDGFSNSILISSPILLLALRPGNRSRAVKMASWAAVVILTFLLWIHGNSGGWQFGYRYAMVLLPWLFVIMLESAPKRLTRIEWTLYSVSFAANIYATWIFHWTDYMKVGG